VKGKLFIFLLLIMSFTSLLFSLANNDQKVQVQTIQPKKEIEKLDRKSVRKILNLPAAAFRPTLDEFKFENGGSELSLRKDAKWLLCSFQAPVSLPDGARLEEIIMYCKDPFRAINVELYLKKAANDSTEKEDIAKVNSYGSDEKIRRFQTSKFVNSIIDNRNYFYYLYVSLQGKLVFKGAKIVYSVLE
jgi:hypothetical protein